MRLPPSPGPVTCSVPCDERRHLKGACRFENLPKNIQPTPSHTSLPEHSRRQRSRNKMNDSRFLPLVTLAVLCLSACLTGVSSQGLMGGFKGHHHRGTGAVELLLATGILAKLLNHRAKHGPSYAGRNILHALIGGPRYPARYNQGRYPMEAHPSLLQDELLEHQASMALPFPEELMLNQESALLGAKAPLLMNPNLPMLTDGQLLAEAQISQQLMAARRARKMLEARKLLAAQEAKNILAVQREAAQLLAAQEAAQTATILANPSRQIFNVAAPPRMMSQQMVQQMAQQMNAGNQGQGENMMGSERNINSRSDSKLFSLPPGLSEQETAQIIAKLAASNI